MDQTTQPHLYLRVAELLRAAAGTVDPFSEWREQVEKALAELDRHEYRKDEPLFVLRGRDPFAPIAVKHWAARAHVAAVNDAKVQGAYDVALRMETTQDRVIPS